MLFNNTRPGQSQAVQTFPMAIQSSLLTWLFLFIFTLYMLISCQAAPDDIRKA